MIKSPTRRWKHSSWSDVKDGTHFTCPQADDSWVGAFTIRDSEPTRPNAACVVSATRQNSSGRIIFFRRFVGTLRPLAGAVADPCTGFAVANSNDAQANQRDLSKSACDAALDQCNKAFPATPTRRKSLCSVNALHTRFPQRFGVYRGDELDTFLNRGDTAPTMKYSEDYSRLEMGLGPSNSVNLTAGDGLVVMNPEVLWPEREKEISDTDYRDPNYAPNEGQR